MSSISEEQQQEYNNYVKNITPTHSLGANMAKAFVTGGTICVIGQAILNFCESQGIEKELAAGWTSLTLILISVLLTGFNLYAKLAKFGGEQVHLFRLLVLPIQ